MTLRDQGYRFVRRGVRFDWVHPAEVQRGDLDCTDMGDDEFERVVQEAPTFGETESDQMEADQPAKEAGCSEHDRRTKENDRRALELQVQDNLTNPWTMGAYQ